MERSLRVRKGAWTEEEDVLLRKCIEKFGEGKWHQVPLRAGLNRCRKSCRLRWLNYLEPNINRGEFTEDEVDLITRLHKLLGNRWSLISGRLPGRTANDVKNYWNTHLRKKIISLQEVVKDKATKTIMKTNIIRPLPRTFSKNSPWLRGKTAVIDNIQPGDNLSKPSTPKPPAHENEVMWWESLLFDKDCDDKIMCSGKSGSEKDVIPNLWIEDNEPSTSVGDFCVDEAKSSCWTNLSLDEDLWNLFNEEQKTMIK